MRHSETRCRRLALYLMRDCRARQVCIITVALIVSLFSCPALKAQASPVVLPSRTVVVEQQVINVGLRSNVIDNLQLRVELTTGERSKDSSSHTTTISIEPRVNVIVWEQTSRGFHGRGVGTPPSRKEYKLSPADRQKLSGLLESKNLLVTKSIEIPDDYPPTHHYFAVSIESVLGRKKGTVSISGPQTAAQVKEEKLYQDSISLVKELYRIINDQGGHVIFHELVLPKRISP